MNYKKLKTSNSSKANELILKAMQRRRTLAFRAIAQVCDKEVKMRVVK